MKRCSALFGALMMASSAVLAASALAQNVWQEDVAGPFVREKAEESVKAFAAQIEENYLFPELGKKYAELIRRNVSAGRYSKFANDRDFTQAVEADLKSVRPDLHLHLIAPSVPKRGVVGTASSPTGTCPKAGAQIERSMGRSGWLAKGVAYVEFCAFRDNPIDLAALRSFLDRHATARVLIVDNRNNNGGGFAESNLLFSRLYSGRQRLLQLDIRRTVDKEMPFPFADGVHWKRLPPSGNWARYAWFAQPNAKQSRLSRSKVYVLTSRWTESAGEGTTLALKVSRRAVVIGERTQGAGHLAPTLPLPGEYRGQVPIGRVYDPRTGIGFEAVGVKPTVRTGSEQALATALRMSDSNVSSGLRAWSQLHTSQPR